MRRLVKDMPGPGQESVWDYPRPPRQETERRLVRVVLAGVELARSQCAERVLETSHPPTYYLPPQDVRMDLLVPAASSSFCEWKGRATHWDAVIDGRRHERVAWSYGQPSQRFASLAHHLAFYLGALDAGYVGDERARPQPGQFYAGWITSWVVGPFKGEPGTEGW